MACLYPSFLPRMNKIDATVYDNSARINRTNEATVFVISLSCAIITTTNLTLTYVNKCRGRRPTALSVLQRAFLQTSIRRIYANAGLLLLAFLLSTSIQGTS